MALIEAESGGPVVFDLRIDDLTQIDEKTITAMAEMYTPAPAL